MPSMFLYLGPQRHTPSIKHVLGAYIPNVKTKKLYCPDTFSLGVDEGPHIMYKKRGTSAHLENELT